MHDIKGNSDKHILHYNSPHGGENAPLWLIVNGTWSLVATVGELGTTLILTENPTMRIEVLESSEVPFENRT